LFGHTGKEPTLRIRPENFRCQNCMQAFISTAFLCCGTMTDPEKSYNLEFLSTRHYLSQQLEAMLAEHDFHPHRALRKGANTIYIKAADHIEDLLTFMGAGGAAMRIMDQRLYNEMRNKTNRLPTARQPTWAKASRLPYRCSLPLKSCRRRGYEHPA
ncbi:MAG: DNA-binding protein WhiA, partial [Gemmiger formicilis]|uniref:DNA-binding protein WhiA n=1 Tax=Gemmiger formicilis TaxID=745368 RepID=UPI003994A883